MPTYRIFGIDVHFPFDAYDCQITYMNCVIQAMQKGCNALLESPTGTGKTLCLLCATLAWRESLGAARRTSSVSPMPNDASPETGQPSLPTIIYTSRTHSQLQQVVRELKSCQYRPKMMILGSREQMCIHKDVKHMRGTAQNNACRSLCRSRKCYHQICVADYVKGHPDLGLQPIDIEDLLSIGRQQGPCPYYLSRELHGSADILFAPYNYLIDKENRQSLTGINWESTILIFDEAHNLESICADAASFDLSCKQLEACISEANKCIELAHMRMTAGNVSDKSIDPEHFAILKALLLKLEKKINETPITPEGFTRPGPYIFEFLEDLKITYETSNLLIDTIDHALTILEDDANSLLSTAQENAKLSNLRLHTLRDALKVIFRGGGKAHASSYRVHIHESFVKNADNASKGKGSITLSWWCFNPGIAMEEFAKLGVRSVILTSGTLSPLDSFASELNLPFEVRLENPHVIGSDQIWVGVISAGPSGRPLNSSYRSRDSVEYKQELGNSIVNFARIVPDGLLVFFPSYYLLNQCIDFWQAPGAASKTSTIWERICKHKQPVIEPKQSALFSYASEDFLAKLNDSTYSGAVFFAVCRGKVSEGLDFADRAGRAVVLTGIPYAMKMDPKVRLKREYLDELSRLKTQNAKCLTGEEWYVQQAARAANQAMGRVIRHRHDYGAIILCDERFSHTNTQNQLSLWLRPHIKCYSKFGDAAFTLTRFFRNQLSNSLPNNHSTDSSSITKNRPTNSIFISSTLSTDIENQGSSMQENLNASVASTSGIDVGDHAYDLKSTQPSITHVPKYNERRNNIQADGSGIFARRTTVPLYSESFSVNLSSRCQKTSSSMLTTVRGNATLPSLNIDVIAPANRATITVDRNRVLSSPRKRLMGLKRSNNNDIQNTAGFVEDEDCQIVDLSQSPCSYVKGNLTTKSVLQVSEKRLKANSIPDTSIDGHVSGKKDEAVEQASGASVGNAKICAGIPFRKNQDIKASTSRNKKDQIEAASCKGDTSQNLSLLNDEKSKNAATFLSEVKYKLSDPEYKIFTDCMKGLRQRTITMTEVLDSMAKLFSTPERTLLFERFGQFVPSQCRQLYDEYLKDIRAKH